MSSKLKRTAILSGETEESTLRVSRINEFTASNPPVMQTAYYVGSGDLIGVYNDYTKK